MMLLWLLLLGGAVIIATSSRPVTEEDVTAVTNHALLAERDTDVLGDLQHALSNAGRFELAELVRSRIIAVLAEISHEIQAVNVPVQQNGGPVWVLDIDPCEQRALEWSRMYGWTIEEARQKVRERVSTCR